MLTDSHLADLQKNKDWQEKNTNKQLRPSLNITKTLQETIWAILSFLTSCKNMYLHMSVELLAVVLLEERLLILRIGCRQVREEQIKESEVRSQ